MIRGCVPKKLLVYGAHFAEDLQDARRFGWKVGSCKFDWPTLRDNVLAEVERLEGIYTDILDRHEVEIFAQRATVTGPNQVTLADGSEISAGDHPDRDRLPPGRPRRAGRASTASPRTRSSTSTTMPKRAVIAGGGYIANEFAGIFHQFSCEVTLVNRGDRILRHYDEQIRDRLLQISLMKGIDFKFNAPFEKIVKRKDGSLRIHLEGHEPDRGRPAALGGRPRRRTRRGSGSRRPASSSARTARSWSTRTISRSVPRSTRSATSPTGSS